MSGSPGVCAEEVRGGGRGDDAGCADFEVAPGCHVPMR